MAITPNYSWPLPDDTSLVKDGAEAIRDLGNAIDTTVDGLPSGGLVHIITADTGGAVASLSVNDCFSADHNAYKLIFNLSNSGADGGTLNLRLRVAGSDNTATNYRRQLLSVNGTSVIGTRVTGLTSWPVTTFFNNITTPNSSLDISNPFETANTFAVFISALLLTGNIRTLFNTASIDVTTSYTGFTVFPDAGTINGSVTVLGYRKS